MVCPFDVITFHFTWEIHLAKDVAIKCDHCIDRQREGRIPACAEVCKVQALQFGELNELVKTARTRLSEEVSMAVGQVRATPGVLPEHVKAWRDLGEATSHLTEKAKEERP
jgi:carbon-monoxide dehydrogenase iron sulfur subunit